jgi:hypothetical protein
LNGRVAELIIDFVVKGREMVEQELENLERAARGS